MRPWSVAARWPVISIQQVRSVVSIFSTQPAAAAAAAAAEAMLHVERDR